MENNNSKTALFLTPKKWTVGIILVFLLLAGFAVRLIDFADLPLDFAPTRQLHSLIMARGIYYQMDTPQTIALDPELRSVGISSGEIQPKVEPTIMEHLAAYTYALLGREWPNAGRLFSILFWVIGGIPLFMLCKRVISVNGGFVALAFYLFVPFGIYASRSFQPDPLMIMCILWALYFQFNWSQTSSTRNAILAGIFTGLAIFVKATAAYFVGLPLAWFVLSSGFKNWVRDWLVYLMAGLSLLPAILFNVLSATVWGNEGSIFGSRFFPELFIDPKWYLRWFMTGKSIVGYFPLILGLLGFFFIKRKDFKIFYLALWVSYLLFGFTFAYHIYTHNYYSLPLIFMIAFGFGTLTDVLFQKLESLNLHLISRALVILLLVGSAGISLMVARQNLLSANYQHEAAYWKELGDKISLDHKVVALSHDYSYRLDYWGFALARNWPTRGDQAVEELNGIDTPDFASYFTSETGGMDYFLVTLIGDFEAQTDLHDYLFAHYPYEQGDGYYLFDLRNPLGVTN